MIVLAVVVPAAALMLLLGMARLEARLLRPDGGGDPPPQHGTARPPVIQRPARPRPAAYAGERLPDDPV